MINSELVIRWETIGVENGKPIRRFQSLMNAGVMVPGHIQALTGITNDMVAAAPAASAVMREVSDFVEDFPLVAHNAAFDQRFWDAELARVKRNRRQEFACSMLIARRVLPGGGTGSGSGITSGR